MLKKPTLVTPEKIELISLEALVPQNHLVRKIAKVMDFEFIREVVTPLYSAILTYGGISLFVVMFAIIPLARTGLPLII